MRELYGIVLLDAAYKLYARILNFSLKLIADSWLGEEQMGFRIGRSTSDPLFILHQTIEKSREFNKQNHIAFVGCVKAFDNVDRSKLWTILERRGYPMHLIRAISSL